MSVVCCPNSQGVCCRVSKVLPVRALMQLGWVAAVVAGIGAGSAIAPLHTQAQTLPQTQSNSIEIAQASAPSSANLLFVNPTLGNDSNSGGSQQNALRTITQALQNAQPNTVILLAPGTYSAESGETFPLALKPGVTIQGEAGARGRGIVIRGGETFLSRTSASQNVTILGEDEATLTGVTVINPNPRGYGLWIESSSPTVNNNTFTGSSHDGISVTGNSAPVIRGNAFVQNGANGITVYGTSRPEIRENVFERTGFGINVTENAAPLIVGNQIRQNQDGIVVQENARPTLRDNVIEANRRDGVVAIAQSFPDLGTATEPGNNQFRNNARQDVNASATSQVIPAFGNQMTGDRTTGRIDLTGVATAPPSRPAPVAQRPFPVPSAISSTTPPTTATTPSPASSAPVSESQPAPAPVATRPTTPSRSESGFSTLPTLEAAPEATPSRTPVSQPSVSRPSSQSSSQTPAPAASRPNVAISPSDAASAVEIPVSPPGSTQALPTARNPLPARPEQTTQPEQAIRPQLPVQATAANTPSEDAPIEIPVPPPQSSAPAPAAQPMREIVVRQTPEQSSGAPSSRTSTATSFAPIEIPVPPPASVTPTPSQPLTAPRAANPVRSANLLPVPGGNIPVGNIGSLPTVSVANSSYSRTSSLGSGSYRGGAAYVRYRVLVEADSESLQAEVRSFIPGAFRTYANGRVMMQAGAFGDRSHADETAQMLNRSGFRALVQPVD